jgi:hypothetical protein
MDNEFDRFLKLAKWVCIGPLIIIAGFYTINLATNQRIAYWAAGAGFFSWNSGITNSPTGKFSAAIQSSGLQGIGHWVRVSRRYWLWPKVAMETATEDFRDHGPHDATISLIWSQDDTAVALVNHGWIVDFYDLSARQRDSWGKGLYLDTDLAALKIYDQHIQKKLGADIRVQVIQE